MNVPALAPISVIIPARNAEKYIHEAIASTLAQTLPITEIIVVADDCADDTSGIAKRLGAKVIEAQHRNISAAINQGVRAATQTWIALLDADDLWDQRKIELQWQALQTFPGAAIISCDMRTLLDGKISSRSPEQLLERRRQVSSVAVFHEQAAYFPQVNGTVLTWFQVSPQTALIRRDVFDHAGFFDEQLLHNANVEFFARALKSFSLVVIEEPLVCYRIHRDNHSTNTEGTWAAYISIVNRMLRHPEQYPAGAGEAYRAMVKQEFMNYERLLARTKRAEPAD